MVLSTMVMHHSSAMLQRFAAAAARSNQKTTFVFANSINNSQAPFGACLKTPIDYEILDLEKWQVR